MEKRFEKITNGYRKEIEELLKTSVIESFQKETVEEGFYKYEVQLNSIKFVTYMSNEELEKSIELTIDLMEELKDINNGGMNAQRLKEKITNIETQYQDEYMRELTLWSELLTKKVHEIIGKMNVVRRVGGAYALLISNPCFKSAIHAVYDRLVDNFDDEELYCQGAYFLVRAVMRMHSDEIKDV